MLKETFIELLTKFTDDNHLKNQLWNEIEQNYLDIKRHYHNLSHLENVLNELLEVKEKISNWETILFSLFYHDLIYNPLKSDNEEQSAQYAEKRMKQIGVPSQIIDNCKSQILATKKHIDNSDVDTNYFTDADLSILGQNFDLYKTYYQNVRQEYSFFPNLVYNYGRKKVLKHFLEMERIYKTEYFYNKYESNAKLNLKNELEHL
jgi:predicted metal-dependent HD superfamily phosphohydrolase